MAKATITEDRGRIYVSKAEMEADITDVVEKRAKELEDARAARPGIAILNINDAILAVRRSRKLGGDPLAVLLKLIGSDALARECKS